MTKAFCQLLTFLQQIVRNTKRLLRSLMNFLQWDVMLYLKRHASIDALSLVESVEDFITVHQLADNVYVVYLAVILIWRYGKFCKDCQIKFTPFVLHLPFHKLHSYTQNRQFKIPQIGFCEQNTKYSLTNNSMYTVVASTVITKMRWSMTVL